MVRLLFCVAAIWGLFLKASAPAALIQQTVVTNSNGGILVPGFNAALGWLQQVQFSATYQGNTASVFLANPVFSHAHSYGGGAGPVLFSGATSNIVVTGSGPSSWSHHHAVSGTTSTANITTGLSAYNAPQFFAASASGSPVFGPTGTHAHNLNVASWAFETTTTFSYLLVESYAATTSGSALILPAFDSSLGTLLQATVNYSWSGSTGGGNPTGPITSLPPHQHTYSMTHTSTGLSIGGSTSVAAGLSPHTFGGSATRTFTGSGLGIFDTGLTLNFFGGTSISNNHFHNFAPSFTATTTFVYEPAPVVDPEPPAPSAVPEPASLALLGIGLAGVAGGSRLKRRQGRNVA